MYVVSPTAYKSNVCALCYLYQAQCFSEGKWCSIRFITSYNFSNSFTTKKIIFFYYSSVDGNNVESNKRKFEQKNNYSLVDSPTYTTHIWACVVLGVKRAFSNKTDSLPYLYTYICVCVVRGAFFLKSHE